ncbi:MAG: class D sortase [Clostridiaceae bacterium]
MKRKYIGIFLILIGITIIGSALYMRYEGNKKQQQMIDEFEKTINQLNKEKPVDNSGDNSNSEYSPDLAPPSLDVKGAIGIMKIPKIDLKVAIGDGVDMNTLKYAVGHFKETPYPGEKGNCAIAGHRSYTYSQYFNRLDQVKEGDTISITTTKGEFTYVVYKIYVVEPSEVSVLNNTKDAELTLITCTPVRVATHRLIIKAKLKL